MPNATATFNDSFPDLRVGDGETCRTITPFIEFPKSVRHGSGLQRQSFYFIPKTKTIFLLLPLAVAHAILLIL